MGSRDERWHGVLIGSLVLSAIQVIGSDVAAATPEPLRSIEEKVRQLEIEQQYLRQTVKDSQDTNKYLLGMFASLMVVIQVASSWLQARREDKSEARRIAHENQLATERQHREDEVEAKRLRREEEFYKLLREREDRVEKRRAEREDRLDAVTTSSVEKVNSVLGVVYSTFDERRKAEQESRQATREVTERLEKLTETMTQLANKTQDLDAFAASVRRTIQNDREAIEQMARKIARETPRHVYRQKAALLADFARIYDAFVNRHGSRDASASVGDGFSVDVSYVRGVSAHYGNDPGLVGNHLERVVESDDIQPGETPELRDKRRVVAYYFLGLCESNFASYDKAIDHFKHAIALERTPRDVLSRLVAAEAAAMGNQRVEADSYLREIEEILAELEREHTVSRRQLPMVFRRHGHRAALIRANMLIAGGREYWAEALRVLGTVGDAHEYYATATAAQIALVQTPDSIEGHDLCRRSYMSIRELGHLQSISEVRSKVLLLLVAGMNARHAEGYTAMADEHLTEAEGLLASLPTRGQQNCTVFSPLSKRNEKSSTILSHIEAIRRGVMLAEV